MKDLRGKVAVVTGGASGIGRALADRFADEGMKIVIADVQQDALDLAVKELESAGADVIGVRTDVSDPSQVETLAASTLDEFGGVHVVCNNAGVAAPGTLWETSIEDWRWTVDVNLWGVVHGVRTFVPIMIERGEPGHVVNTASAAGLASGVPLLSAYSVTKHAVVALSEALDSELAQIGAPIGVSVLCPLLVKTGITRADRNRPGGSESQTKPGERSATFWQMLSAGVDHGTEPSVVANTVLQAILEDKLYALPHPELRDQVRTRMEAILETRSTTGERP